MSPPRLRHPLLPVLLLSSLGAASHAGAPAYLQVRGSARVTIEGGTVHDGALGVPLSGTLLVALAVEGASSLAVEPIKVVMPGEGWAVREPLPAATRLPLGEGRVRWQQAFTLEPLKPGEAKLTLPPLRYRDAPGEGDWQTVQWDEISVQVTTEVASADVRELRDVPPPEDPGGTPPGWPRWPVWILPPFVMATLALVLWLRLRRKPETPRPLLPHEWAAAELDRVEALGLPAKGDINRYHTLLSDVVRRYLELRFQLRAPQQTTAEFLKAVQGAPQLPPEQRDVLRDFLERCDIAKFSGASPTSLECEEAAAMARSLVAQTAADAAGVEQARQA
jgi:hypothetical protein